MDKIFKKLKFPAFACFLVYSGITAGVWQFQDNLLYQGLSIGQPKSGLGPWTLRRPDLTLHGWVENPGQSKAVVLFGGNAMALEPFRGFLSSCTTRTVYLIPYRGFEGQAGHPSQKALIDDGVAIVEELQKHHSKSVAVLGISLGSGVAIQVAHRTQVDRIALITPYDSILNVAKDHMWGFPVEGLLKDTYDSAAIAPFVHQPVFILRASYDLIVRPRRTDALIKAFGRPIQVQWSKTGHNGVWDPKFQAQTCAFIKQALDG